MESFDTLFYQFLKFVSGEKTNFDLQTLAIVSYVEWLLRYVLIAGVFWLIFYVFKISYFIRNKVDPRMPAKKQIAKEILYSLSSLAIYTLTGLLVLVMRTAGYNQVYWEIDDNGWGYFFFSVAVSILMHDTYFYWTHRLIHMRRIFPYVHRIHHLSNNPSPWAAFAFHPLEAAITAIYVPILLMILPMHPIAIFLFLLHMTVMNVWGHCGYEIFPSNFLKTKWSILYNSTTHHAMHHKRLTSNYGLYFNFWDRLMKTNHPEYEKIFAEVTRKNAFGNSEAGLNSTIRQPNG